MTYEDSFAFKLLQKFESLRERVRHYAAIAELCPLPVFITSRDGSAILYVNSAYQRLTGKTEEFLQNLDWLAVIHADDRERALQAWKNFIDDPKDGESMVQQLRYIHGGSGHSVTATAYTTAVVNNGLVSYIVPTQCSDLLNLGIRIECTCDTTPCSALPA